ncbi:RNA-dependent RNA polymerase [Wuchang cockroach Virus 4]|uniref:RNA-dependent RNA polymerase n=1 Tax=Wuchang cockroach Virus 4 TaxID=1923688 RepID=UPI00090B5B21|nr:RNA-dependent RNA polymerase [Wuchang cockroach Virus 4]APG77306.1 RNA-dependent RNA polymerase [Wuchang cockroach Virus 4]
MEYILCTPVVNGDGLRAGSFLRFFIRRSRAYPARLSDGPVGLSSFVSDVSQGQLPQIKIPPMESPAVRRRVASICNAFLAAWIEVWPKAQYGLEANLANILPFRSLAHLIKWVIRTYLGNGETYLRGQLKLFAAWLRFLAGDQLHLPPSPLRRFPFSSEDGRLDPTLLFTGSISAKAGSPAALLAFSRFARALPAGNKQAEVEALHEHFKLMQSTPEVVPPLAKHFREVASKVGKDSLSDIEKPGMTLSFSSSLERSRAEGGAAEEIREVTWDYFPGLRRMHFDVDMQTDVYVSSFEIDPKTDDLVVDGTPYDYGFTFGEGLPGECERVVHMAHAACIYKAFGTEHLRGKIPLSLPRVIPKHRVIAVPDRGGLKVRVITAGPACLQSLAHNVRKVIYRSVLSKTPTQWGIIEHGPQRFLEQLKLPADRDPELGPWVALSCDMRSATDNFPHYLVEAINDGLEQNLPEDIRSSPNWVAWRSLSGPQTLFYKDILNEDGESSEITSTCGNLMGTAPSWALLNIFNLSIFRLAWSLWSSRDFRRRCRRQFGQESDSAVARRIFAHTGQLRELVLREISRDKFHPWRYPKGYSFNELTCLVGDDLAAACPLMVAALYETLLGLAGGSVSTGKHYVQPWEDGNFLLVAEEFGRIEGQGIRRLHFEHLRAFTQISSSVDTRSKKETWAQLGSALDSAVRSCRSTHSRALCSFGHIASSGLRQRMLKLGLPVYLPTSVGGLGWPHPRGLLVGLSRTSALALRAYRVLRGFRSDPVKFSCEIARLRATWYLSEISHKYLTLLEIVRGYCTFPVSRDKDGKVAPLTEECPIGFPNEDFPDSVNLFDFIEEVVISGISAGFISGEETFSAGHISQRAHKAFRIVYTVGSGTSQTSTRSRASHTIQAAARSFRRACRRLLDLRQGNIQGAMSYSDYMNCLAEDEELLARYHVLKNCDRVRSVLPSFATPLQEDDQMSPPQEHLGRSCVLHV